MPLFYLDEQSHELSVSSSIWVYFLFSLPLTAVSFGYWQWSLGRKRRDREEALRKPFV